MAEISVNVLFCLMKCHDPAEKSVYRTLSTMTLISSMKVPL